MLLDGTRTVCMIYRRACLLGWIGTIEILHSISYRQVRISITYLIHLIHLIHLRDVCLFAIMHGHMVGPHRNGEGVGGAFFPHRLEFRDHLKLLP